MKTSSWRLILVALPLLMAACSDSGDSPTSPNTGNGGTTVDTVSFATDVRPILSANCAVAGCHGTGSTSGGMTLGAATWANVMAASGDHGAIVQSTSATSNLYLKVTSSPPFGSRMPAGRAPLTNAQIAAIRDWIDQGAQDN